MPPDYSSEGKLSIFPFDPRYRPIAPPETGIFDAPTVSICVNIQWVGHLEGVIDRLLWRDAWQGSFEVQEWAIAQIRKLLIQFMQRNPCGDEDMPFKLRQNPGNPCQLQQSLDGGVTWSLAFDYSLCRPATSPLLEFNFEQQINQLFDQWQQTTSNTEINPSAPEETFTSSTGEDENRLNARRLALCYATRLYIDGYCEAIKQINESAATWSNLTALALGVGAAVITILSSGATLPLWLALSAGMIQLGTEAYTFLTDSVLDDEIAREAVACLMYNTLKDLAPTAENFATAVDSGTLTGNAELIRSTLAVDISNEAGLENQFNAFINLLGDSLRPAELGLIDDCPCEGVTVTVPATADLPGFDSEIDVVSGLNYEIAASGTWNGGAGGNVDADGQIGNFHPSSIAPTENLYSLLYRIGTTGDWLFVGTTNIITPLGSGRLYFICNDVSGSYIDNSGALTVRVTEV